MDNVTKPHQNFSVGKCFTNKIHIKLGHNCLLHYALHIRNIINSPFCWCGKQKMCIISFLLCKNYTWARNNLFYQLVMLDLVNIYTNSQSYSYDNPPLHSKISFLLPCSKLLTNLQDSSNLFLFKNVFVRIYFTCNFIQ